MRQWRLMVSGLLVMSACSQPHQGDDKPYAGLEQRQIKALSESDIAAYRGGHGMGLAKAAEMNHYPGPKHILELAGSLSLSETQLAATQKIYDRMHAQAVRLGEAIVAKEKDLDSLFATQVADSAGLFDSTSEIALLQGRLRAVHLFAHIEMKQMLSLEQIARYDEMRGYRRGQADHQHRH